MLGSGPYVSHTYLDDGTTDWKSWVFPSLFAVFAVLMLCCICFSCCAARSENRDRDANQLKRINKEARRAATQQATTCVAASSERAELAHHAPSGSGAYTGGNGGSTPVPPRMIYQAVPVAHSAAYPGLGYPAYRPSDLHPHGNSLSVRMPQMQQYGVSPAGNNPYVVSTHQSYYHQLPAGSLISAHHQGALLDQQAMIPSPTVPVVAVSPPPTEHRPAGATLSVAQPANTPTVVIQVPEQAKAAALPSAETAAARGELESLAAERRRNAYLEDRVKWLETCMKVSHY